MGIWFRQNVVESIFEAECRRCTHRCNFPVAAFPTQDFLSFHILVSALASGLPSFVIFGFDSFLFEFRQVVSG